MSVGLFAQCSRPLVCPLAAAAAGATEWTAQRLPVPEQLSHAADAGDGWVATGDATVAAAAAVSTLTSISRQGDA